MVISMNNIYKLHKLNVLDALIIFIANFVEFEGIMASSKDVDELAHYFNSWHNKMSDLVPPKYYREFVNYLNEYANANGENTYYMRY